MYVPQASAAFGVVFFHDTLWRPATTTGDGAKIWESPSFVERLRKKGIRANVKRDYGVSSCAEGIPPRVGISLGHFENKRPS